MKYLKVLEESWDVLLLLDACRYDYFEKYNWIEGTLEKRKSIATCTLDWLIKNFPGVYPDIVYVSGNPLINSYWAGGMSVTYDGKKHFPIIDDVWDYGWSNELGTTLPDEVSKAVLRNLEKYPDKRIIAHYMQPHLPYIGEHKILGFTGRDFHPRKTKGTPYNPDYPIMIKAGKEISFRELVIGYRDNLKCVLKSIEKILDKLSGRIVITSDHGEMLGEYNKFTHSPPGQYWNYKEITTVPWFIVKGGE